MSNVFFHVRCTDTGLTERAGRMNEHDRFDRTMLYSNRKKRKRLSIPLVSLDATSKAHGPTACTFSKYGDILGVAIEGGNDVTYPFQCKDLVLQAVVSHRNSILRAQKPLESTRKEYTNDWRRGRGRNA